MNIRIEAGRAGVLEPTQEFLFVPSMRDVIANIVGVLQRQNDQVVTHSKSEGTGSRSLGFLVLCFTMDDGGHMFHGVLAHPFPYTHHVAASRVDNLAAPFLDLLQRVQVGAKGGYDDDIVCSQFVDLGLASVAKEIFDSHGCNLLIHERIMNDLTENK